MINQLPRASNRRGGGRRVALHAGIAAVLVASVAGCGPDERKLELSLQAGEQAYREKRHSEAIRSLSKVISESRQEETVARALYVRGMARAATNERIRAYSDLNQAIENAAPDVRYRALGVLGVMQFEDRNWAQAARTLWQAASEAPVSPPTDAWLYRVGLARERSGDWSGSLAAYQRIVQQFGGGQYAALARRRLEIRATHFAVQCGVFQQRASADRQVAEMRREGFDAYVRTETRAGQSTLVVLIGKFGEYEPAVQMLRRVRGYIPDAVIWP